MISFSVVGLFQRPKERAAKKITMKKIYLDTHVFYGLKDQNTGFDAPSIRYFSEADFKTVLDRIEQLGIGIVGIEPWKNGTMYDVLAAEEFGLKPEDAQWYRKAFELFKRRDKDLLYAATYSVPERLLK